MGYGTQAREQEADLIPDAHKEAMNAMIGTVNQQLGKHSRPLGMHSRVGDPVLLSYSAWGVNDELVSLLVKGGCGLHLHGVVACMLGTEWRGVFCEVRVMCMVTCEEGVEESC